MTAIKLDSKLHPDTVPDELAKRMFDGLGGHHLAIVELQVKERTEPADGIDAEESAKLRVTGLEFAADTADADRLRQAMRDRYLARTAVDTLEAQGDVVFADRTDPDVGFHDAFLAYLEERGTIAGYPVTVQYGALGGLDIHISGVKADA